MPLDRWTEIRLRSYRNLCCARLKLPPERVELDLAEVSYMSSAGLRVLLQAAKVLQKRGERLRLVNVPPQIYNVLNLAGFTSFIDIKT
jgi:anti-anti-sigma factor